MPQSFTARDSKPVVIPFTYALPFQRICIYEYPMLVELAQALYEPLRFHEDAEALYSGEYPDWYLRGFLHKSAFAPVPETMQMHVHLDVESDEGEIQEALLQVVRRPSGADPTTRLVYGNHAPGQENWPVTD